MWNPIEIVEKNCIERDRKLAEAIDRVIRQQNLNGQLSSLQTQKEIVTSVYSSASSYSNLIMLGGYAGIFALWQLTKDLLHKNTVLITAVLMTISILLYVLFEVQKMIFHAWFIRRLNKYILSKINEAQRIEAWKIAWVEYELMESRIWLLFLIPTVLTGFGAGIILLSNFLLNLW